MEGHNGFERCSSVKTTSKDMRRRPNVPKEIPGSLDAILFCKYVYIVLNCSCLFLLWCWTANIKTYGPTSMVWVGKPSTTVWNCPLVPFDIQACAQLKPNTKGGYCNFAASNSVSLKTRISKSWKLPFCGYHAVNEVLSQAEPCGSRAWQLDLHLFSLLAQRAVRKCFDRIWGSIFPRHYIELWNWSIVLG